MGELEDAKEPDDFNSIPDNPYKDDLTCKSNINGIYFSKISNKNEDKVLFKPLRLNVSDIFIDSGNIGCVRKDLTLFNNDDINSGLHCNTNIASPLERDKHTMIEYIIKRSNNTLDESDRIKLSLMNDEELVNKAFQLNININELNKYTKPKAILKERNIFNSSLKDN